jgi:hypothetical protein
VTLGATWSVNHVVDSKSKLRVVTGIVFGEQEILSRS